MILHRIIYTAICSRFLEHCVVLCCNPWKIVSCDFVSSILYLISSRVRTFFAVFQLRMPNFLHKVRQVWSMQRAPKLPCEIRVFKHTKENTSAVCFSLTIPEVSAREGVLQRIGSQTYVTWNHGTASNC